MLNNTNCWLKQPFQFIGIHITESNHPSNMIRCAPTQTLTQTPKYCTKGGGGGAPRTYGRRGGRARNRNTPRTDGGRARNSNTPRTYVRRGVSKRRTNARPAWCCAGRRTGLWKPDSCFSIPIKLYSSELRAVVKPHQKERSNAAFGNGNRVTEFLKTTCYITRYWKK